MNRFSRTSCLFVVAFSAIAASGCSDKLETGYKPRKLGASESQRRAFYASPYSADSMPEEQIEGPTHRRPNQ